MRVYPQISVGSSPLTRGTLLFTRLESNYFRFIPAYAGNSIFLQASELLIAVHPRLRGELFTRRKSNVKRVGSSPLTRGTHQGDYKDFLYPRFIPAYAGNSAGVMRYAFIQTVHPRLRGELISIFSKCFCISGSSPLTRGTPNEGQERET